MQKKQEKQKKRREYAAPQLVKMGGFKESTGWDTGNGYELLFFWPRIISRW